jgi:putative DNA primase/helicase
LKNDRQERWDKIVLSTLNDDRELFEWIQRFFGYSLSGFTSEQIFLMIQGSGSDGKSVLKDAIRKAMGSYFVVMSKDCIVESRGQRSAGQASSHKVQLQNSRLAICDESSEGAKIDEASIKELTGCESISTREMHQRQMDMAITFKIALSTNYLPKQDEISYSMFRRTAIVRLRNTFVAKENFNKNNSRHRQADNTIAEYVISRRGSKEVLQWLIEGAVRYFEAKGRNPDQPALQPRPTCMKESLDEYKKDQDVISRFISERLKFEGLIPKNYKVPTARLLEEFQEWVQINGDPNERSKTGRALEKSIQAYADINGFVLKQVGKVIKDSSYKAYRGIIGIVIKPEGEIGDDSEAIN